MITVLSHRRYTDTLEPEDLQHWRLTADLPQSVSHTLGTHLLVRTEQREERYVYSWRYEIYEILYLYSILFSRFTIYRISPKKGFWSFLWSRAHFEALKKILALKPIITKQIWKRSDIRHNSFPRDYSYILRSNEYQEDDILIFGGPRNISIILVSWSNLERRSHYGNNKRCVIVVIGKLSISIWY